MGRIDRLTLWFSEYGYRWNYEQQVAIASGRKLCPLIETDLSLNASESGGALVGLNGDVIGIEAPVHRAFQGLSFAIPIDVAMSIERQLQLHEKCEHGHLGVTIQEVAAPLTHSFGMAEPVGALISSVDENGPSAKSGLRAGDIILQVNGVTIADSTQLPMTIAALRPGWRDHENHEASVALESMRCHAFASGVPTRTMDAQIGLTARSLTSEEQRKAGVTGGVRVEQSSGACGAGWYPTGRHHLADRQCTGVKRSSVAGRTQQRR